MPCALCNDATARESRVDVRHASDVIASAKDCGYCKIILDVLAENAVDPDQRLHVVNDDNTSTTRATGGIMFLVMEKGKRYGSQFDFVIRNLRACDSTALLLVLYSGLTYTGSAQALEWAKTQIETCQSTHSTCRTDDHVRPDRLIYIGHREGEDSDWLLFDVNLYESSNEVGRYATLSHRWGKTQPLRLLEGNMALFRDRIPWSDLPRTFQQAINFARRLGIDYIWIDSLCIIQDSKQDWEEQALKMASIYENSFLTLAASVAENGEAGCFVDPPAFLQGYVTDGIAKASCNDLNAILELAASATERPIVFVRGTSEHAMPSSGLPLLTRGWVFQERLLSPRLLHFSHLDLIYECSWRTECYCKKQAGAGTRSVRNHPPKLQHANALGNGMFEGVGGTVDAYTQRWCAIIEEYSALDLTCSTDRMPAIAGLAKQISRYMPVAQYMSGIWTTNLVVYLLWQRKKNPPSVNGPKTRAGPSWSWVTMPGQLYYPMGSFFLQDPNGYDTSADPKPQVVDINFDFEGERDFMALKNGSITLNGILLKVRLVKMHGDSQQDEVCIVPFEKHRRFVNVVLDHSPDAEELENDWDTVALAERDASNPNFGGASTPIQSLKPPEDLDPTYPFHPWNRPLRSITQHRDAMWAFCLGTWYVDSGKNDQFLLLQRIEGPEQGFRRIGSGSDEAKHLLFRSGGETQDIELR